MERKDGEGRVREEECEGDTGVVQPREPASSKQASSGSSNSPTGAVSASRGRRSQPRRGHRWFEVSFAVLVLLSAWFGRVFGWLSCFSGFSGLVLVESGGKLRVPKESSSMDDAVYDSVEVRRV